MRAPSTGVSVLFFSNVAPNRQSRSPSAAGADRSEVDDLLPDFLAAVMRSSIIVAQTRHMMTGNTHPRLANEDVVGLLIPIPDLQRFSYRCS